MKTLLEFIKFKMSDEDALDLQYTIDTDLGFVCSELDKALKERSKFP